MHSTEELVKAARVGNSEAIIQLVDRYQRAAVTTAWAITKDFHRAQDVAQDCFVTAFTQLNALKADKAFGRWLMTIVRRTALRHREHRSNRTECHLMDDIAESVPQWIEQFTDTLQLLERLPAHEQEVIRLRYLSDLALRKSPKSRLVLSAPSPSRFLELSHVYVLSVSKQDHDTT